MVKQEVTEIKKLYSIKNCTVTRIAGCYVNPDGEIIAKFAENFLNKDEEEIHKYLDIFKKGLSGKIGKELNTLRFLSTDAGSMQDFLIKLRASGLKDDALLDAFWNQARQYYAPVENALFLLINNTYDIPGRGDDNFKNIDASDEVFDYISFYVCPVKLEDGGLAFDAETGKFTRKITRWCVQAPTYSFLFPSFEDRSADPEYITVYTKKTDGSMNEFSRQLLNADPMKSAEEQKQSFQKAVELAISTSGTGAGDTVEIIKNIHENIADKIALSDAEDPSVPLTLDKKELINIAERSGMNDDMVEALGRSLDDRFGNGEPVVANNIVNPKMIQFKSPDFVVQVDTKLAEVVKTDMINNTRYLMIPITSDSDVRVSGISVKRK